MDDDGNEDLRVQHGHMHIIRSHNDYRIGSEDHIVDYWSFE